MTDQTHDVWSMTDQDVRQAFEPSAADPTETEEEWDPVATGFGDDLDSSGGLPSFTRADPTPDHRSFDARSPLTPDQPAPVADAPASIWADVVRSSAPADSGEGDEFLLPPQQDEPAAAEPAEPSSRFPDVPPLPTSFEPDTLPAPAPPSVAYSAVEEPQSPFRPAPPRPAPPRPVAPTPPPRRAVDATDYAPAPRSALPDRPAPPRPAPAPVPVPVPRRETPDLGDDPDLVKDPEKGISGVRRRMGRKLASKPLPPEQMTMNVKKPLPRPVIVAVVSHTGGVGKSTMTAAIGQQLATHRRDRVIAIDAAAAVGGLSQRLPVQNQSTIQTMLTNLSAVRRWSDAREHTSQGRTGLELLASGTSIADDALLTADGYRAIVDVLTANDTYNLLLVDCDGGVTGDLKDAILDSADVVVVPASGVDGVNGAVMTMNRLDYLAEKYPHRAAHFRGLISTAVVALCHVAPKSILRDDEVAETLRERVGVREVVSVPFDPALKDGQEVDIMLVARATANAVLQLAAETVSSLRRSV